MKRSVKRILPVLLVILILCSIVWYLGVYDRAFTQDMLLSQARFFDDRGNHNVAAWLYDLAYRQSNNDEAVAIELAEAFKQTGNYTKAEYTLSNAIADGGSLELYIALCKTYVQQDKLLDAVSMLDNVADPAIKEQLEALRPQAPGAEPAPGFYSQYITVDITAASGTLYVTTDQQYPSTSQAPYTGPVQLVGGENTIYALAVGENGLVSKLSVFGYVVGGVIEEVTLSDSAMDAAVREILGKNATDVLTSAELWTITSLDLPKEVQSLTDLQYLPYLKTLTMETPTVSSLNGLSALTGLTELTIRGTVLSSGDVSTIASLPSLEKLTLENCGLASIATLTNAQKLTYLDLSDNTIRDIGVLSGMTTLEYLDLSHNALTDLSQLSSLTKLKELNVSYNSLTSLSPLEGCTGLISLDASHNTIGVLSGLDKMSVLAVLNLSYNNLTDASVLASNLLLTNLDISDNTILDITALSVLNQLTDLNFSNNEVAVLPAFSKDSPLVNISGSNNLLTSLEELSGLMQLNNVVMEHNSISSVDCLANCHRLIMVNVYGNPVKDVSALTDQSVIVYYTPV